MQDNLYFTELGQPARIRLPTECSSQAFTVLAVLGRECMNDYDLIAPFYDIEHAHFREDLDMYSNYAELCGGKIMELACGSGRALLPLCQAGYELTGVDTSAAMLAI